MGGGNKLSHAWLTDTNTDSRWSCCVCKLQSLFTFWRRCTVCSCVSTMGCSLCTIQRSDEHYKLLRRTCQVKKMHGCVLVDLSVSVWFVYSSLAYARSKTLTVWLNSNRLRNVIHFYWINYELIKTIEWTHFECLWGYAVCLWSLFCMLKRLRKVILPKEGMCFGDCVHLIGSWEGHTLLKKSEQCLASHQNT